MIRDLLDEPAPSPEVVAEGRKRLLAEHAHPERRVRVGLWGAMAVGLTSVAAAAALGAAMLGSGAGSSPGGGAPIVTIASARSVLLAAAVQAESAPTHGTYWHVRSMSRTTLPRMFGHGENRYALEQLSVAERWTTRAGRTSLGRRQWVRPKTPADEAAWRRDGAPRRWCIGHTDTAPPQPICLATSPGTASLTRVGPDTFQVAEGHDLTFGQLQRLPTGAGALRAWLVRIARHDLDPSAGPAVVDLNVEEELSNLLVGFPVPPAVRAAAFRALAGMPGVTSTGPARDQLGRAGIGIQIRGPRRAVFVSDGSAVAAREGRFTRVLIIDPKTSRVLADRVMFGRSPRPVIDTVIMEAGWSNERPQLPPL